MTLHVLLLVNDGRGQGLLVRLTLEDLLFDRAGRDEAIDEAWTTRSGLLDWEGEAGDIHSFFCPSRHTRASACWSAAGFQSIAQGQV